MLFFGEQSKERIARAICEACEEDPDYKGDCRGNQFRWQDYLPVANAAIDAVMAELPPNKTAQGVLVRFGIPEGYEDVAPEILVEDAMRGSVWTDYEIVPSNDTDQPTGKAKLLPVGWSAVLCSEVEMDDIVLRLEREAARETHEPIWRDAANEIKILRHAVATLLGDTEDSDYMSAAERRELARKALHNPAHDGERK